MSPLGSQTTCASELQWFAEQAVDVDEWFPVVGSDNEDTNEKTSPSQYYGDKDGDESPDTARLIEGIIRQLKHSSSKSDDVLDMTKEDANSSVKRQKIT